VLGFQRHKADGFSTFVYPGASFALLFRPTDDGHSLSPVAEQRLDHLAMLVPTVEALEQWRADLSARGVEVEIEHSAMVGSSITLFDPDGLEIELFTPAPGTVLDVGSLPC
jgi:catechol-2,3-dioxygenase